jgi:arylsulfatase A-like enzyme
MLSHPPQKNRLTAACLCFFAIWFVATCSAETASPPKKLNVLLVIVDDLGFADLSCLGSEDMQTPNLDQLYSESLKLGSLYANCPVCSPTRAAVLTGCYPDRVGVPGVIRTHRENNWGYYQPFTQTLPHQLQENGYETIAIGKWHLGLSPATHPLSQGFDRFQGYLGDMMDDYYKHRRHGINYMRDDRTEIDPKGHATDLFTQWAVEYINGHAKEAVAEADVTKDASSTSFATEPGIEQKPWFLYLAYNAPHTPIQPPEDWYKKVKVREQANRDTAISDKRAKIVALIEHMDAGIGEVLNALKKSGQFENTVIVFTSDNGGQANVGANNGPLRGEKQQMYEGGLRIPGCIRVPNQTKAGATSHTVCCTADFFPTIVDLAGIEVASGIDGQSLLPLIKQPLAANGINLWPSREIYFVRREGGPAYSGLTSQALLAGHYKLVHDLPTKQFELFDLKSDPAESTNLAKKLPKKLRDLSRRLQLHVQQGGHIPWQPPVKADEITR